MFIQEGSSVEVTPDQGTGEDISHLAASSSWHMCSLHRPRCCQWSEQCVIEEGRLHLAPPSSAFTPAPQILMWVSLPCRGELLPLHLNATTAPRHDNESASNEIQRITANGTEIRGRGTKNTVGKQTKKVLKKEIWKLPCRYLGTTEFSFFSQMGRRHTWLGPTHKLHCVTSLVARVGKGSATLPTKVPHHGTFWSRPS